MSDLAAGAIRLHDYAYIDWYTMARRIRPDWTEEQFDASWDRHLEFPVHTPAVTVSNV